MRPLSNMLLLLCLYFLLSFDNGVESKKKHLHLRPIIGIVSQKVTTKYTPKVKDSDFYIAASYIKYLEMAGAQTVPILPTYSEKKKKELLSKINGVLFPGGAAPLNDSGYFKTAALVFKVARKLNDAGVYFPLWGTCLGFETLHALTAQEDVISKVDAENYTVPLNLTKDAFKSRMFQNMDKELLQSLMFEDVALNMHNMGVRPSVYSTNKNLNVMFRVLSTNHDRQGKEFVSTVEGISYPFYGTQWHPEKNIFEWTKEEAINHSPNAIGIAQYLSYFFVNEARQNGHHFEDLKEENEMVMSRYSPVYSGGSSLFEQVYVFGHNTTVLIQ